MFFPPSIVKNYHLFACHKILLYAWKFRGIPFNACRWLGDNNSSFAHLDAFDNGWKGMSEYLIFLSVFINGFTIKDGSAVCMELGRCRFIFWAVSCLPFCEYIDAFFHFAVHWCPCICNKPADTLIKYINRLYYNAAFRCGSSVTHAHTGEGGKRSATHIKHNLLDLIKMNNIKSQDGKMHQVLV